MRTLTIVASAALLLLASVVAHAHALLDRAEPRVGSVVHQAPHEVALTFTQTLEGSFSTVEVTDAAGQRVDEGAPVTEGNVMRVPLKPLASGVFRVTWHVLSVDTHKTEGSFTFEIRP
jgi:methionine-rich copper-binding protein CopC